MLSNDWVLSTRSLLPPETWDSLPLSLVCNPYCKPSAGKTSSSELDVGTFCPNQYKPLCPLSTPFELDAQIQIYSSVVRKHRHKVCWPKRAIILFSSHFLQFGNQRSKTLSGIWYSDCSKFKQSCISLQMRPHGWFQIEVFPLTN